MSTGPKAPSGKPEGEFKYILFAAPKFGADYPYQILTTHGAVGKSVALEWPAWLPYIDVKTHAPKVAGAHTRWPIVAKPGDTSPLPHSKVAAIFTNDDIVWFKARRIGWVDVSDLWRKAEEAARHPAPPEQAGREVVDVVVTKRRGRGASDTAQAV